METEEKLEQEIYYMSQWGEKWKCLQIITKISVMGDMMLTVAV